MSITHLTRRDATCPITNFISTGGAAVSVSVTESDMGPNRTSNAYHRGHLNAGNKVKSGQAMSDNNLAGE